MIKIKREGALRIAVCSVFICLLITAFICTVTFAGSARDKCSKIHFLASPNPIAFFDPPVGKDADVMLVWVAVYKDSSFGSFKMAMFGYMTGSHEEFHWYTDNLRAGKVLADLTAKIESAWGFTVEYDITLARIDIDASEHELSATVIVKGKTVFSVEFQADTSSDLVSRVDPISTLIPEEQFHGVELYRPLLTSSVTGLDHGTFREGRFDYIDTEIYDSSLLQ